MLLAVPLFSCFFKICLFSSPPRLSKIELYRFANAIIDKAPLIELPLRSIRLPQGVNNFVHTSCQNISIVKLKIILKGRCIKDTATECS